MLKETMSSILAQSYRPVEIVVVDDGSTDNTGEVLAAYGDRIRYFRQENRGVAAARTFACRQLARGEYIAFHDDDDMMMPHRITCLYEAMNRYPQAVLATGDWELIDAQGKPSDRRVTFDIEGQKGVPILIEDGYRAVMWPLLSPLPNATLFKRADGESINWMDTRFSRSSDTDFFARLGKLGPIVYVPKAVTYYRRGHGQMWSNTTENRLLCERNDFLLFEKHLNLSHGQKEMRARLRKRMLFTMKSIAYLSSIICKKRAEMVMADYAKRGLRLLGKKERLSYAWYVNARLPLRRVLKGKS